MSHYSRKHGPIYQAIQDENRKRLSDSLSPPPDISLSNKWDRQYEDASLDFYYSLSTNEKIEIFLEILGRRPYILVFDGLSNNACSGYFDSKERKARKDKWFSIPLENEIKQGIIRHWKQRHIINKFVNDFQEYAIMRGNRILGIKEPYWIVLLGPIKNIKGKIIVGFETYSGPLAAQSCRYIFEKKNGKWKISNCWGPISVS